MKFKDMPYERVDYEKVEKEFEQLIAAFQNAKSGEEQFAIHQEFYKLTNKTDTQGTIANIRHDIDNTDQFYEEENNYYDEMQPKYANMITKYKKQMYQSPYRAYLEEKIGPVAFKTIELQLKSFDEKIIALMQEENALATQYNKIIAMAKIDWDGEDLNLSLLRPYLTNNDREIRQKAWDKYSAFFVSVEAELEDLFDKLVKNRTKQAKELGYENYTELGYYRMNRNSYDRAMVENYRKQVQEYLVPFVEKLQEKRRKRLGLSKLTYIDKDVFFKNGNPNPTGTPEEIMRAGQKMYEEMSAETKEFFDFMMEKELFDVLGRKTKKAGGYMTYLPDYQSPFIFANFNGTSDDVDVITHECGHAFQGYLSGKDPIQEHRDITMETAEIHSMGMEFFAEPWTGLFFDRVEDYKEMHLEDAATFIPYGCMVDEFQHIVYDNPDMTPDERNKAWLSLEKKYRPHMDYEEDAYFSKGGFWQKQQHIFNWPFYYIDYCLAQTCALQYKVKMDEDREAAWKSYLELCKLSAGDFYPQMLKKAGLESPFEDGCVRGIIEKLESKLA